MLLAALALLITGCAQQTFTVQTNRQRVAPKETITHHFFVSGIGQKTVDAAKFVAAQEIIVKTKPANIRKVSCSVLHYFRHLYTPLEARWCIAHNNCMGYLDMGSSIYCSLIYFWVPSSCFCIVISLSLRRLK